jgi:hypothetical protein
MDFVRTPMNFSQWEYDADCLDKYSAELDTGISTNYDEDMQPAGILVRWKYTAQSELGVILHCVAEDSYSYRDVKAVKLDDIVATVQNSFNNFQMNFNERLGEEDISLQIPSPNANTASLEEVLRHLHKQG